MPFKDLEKRREYRRKWYSENKESERNHIVRRKREIRNWFKKYKSNLKCFKCEETHPATLDFHHSDKNKEEGISKMVSNGNSPERIQKEIKKCQVLCANCHRKAHYSQ